MKITEQAKIVSERGKQKSAHNKTEYDRNIERARAFEIKRNMLEPHVVLVNEEQETIIKVESLTYSVCVFAYAVVSSTAAIATIAERTESVWRTREQC